MAVDGGTTDHGGMLADVEAWFHAAAANRMAPRAMLAIDAVGTSAVVLWQMGKIAAFCPVVAWQTAPGRRFQACIWRVGQLLSREAVHFAWDKARLVFAKSSEAPRTDVRVVWIAAEVVVANSQISMLNPVPAWAAIDRSVPIWVRPEMSQMRTKDAAGRGLAVQEIRIAASGVEERQRFFAWREASLEFHFWVGSVTPRSASPVIRIAAVIVISNPPEFVLLWRLDAPFLASAAREGH